MPCSPAGLHGSSAPPPLPGILVLIIAGTAGFGFGLRYPTWQWGVELAQVTAGVVRYPPDAPAAALHAHLWSALDQITAVLLRAGLHERVLSWTLSAIAGMASAQALAMLTFALTRAVLPAVIVPLVLLPRDLTAFGVSYPVLLAGSPHTYGVLGLSLSMLALGLVGCGWRRSGFVLAGLAIACQASTGIPVALALAAAGLALRSPFESRDLRAISAGWLLAAVSGAVFLLTRPAVPHLEAAAASRFLASFVSFWDGHRLPAAWRHRGVAIDLAVLALSIAWLWRPAAFPARVPARLMVGALAIAAAASAPLAMATWLDPARLPNALVIAMPGRLMNIAVFAAGPLLAALVWNALERVRTRRWPMRIRQPLLTWSLGIAAATWSLVYPNTRLVHEPTTLRRADDPVWAVASARPGLLLTSADVWLAQVRTRRPVLLDAATLDTLPYALDAGPSTEAILNDVYEQSLFTPPGDARGRGRASIRVNREAWTRWESSDWTRVRRAYGVTDVLTPADWPLRLPVAAASPSLRLYAIPPG